MTWRENIERVQLPCLRDNCHPTAWCEWCCALAALTAQMKELEAALDAIIHELGVPDENYPAPIANAVAIARGALDPPDDGQR